MGDKFQGEGSEQAALTDAGMVERQAESFPVRAIGDTGKDAGVEAHDLARW